MKRDGIRGPGEAAGSVSNLPQTLWSDVARAGDRNAATWPEALDSITCAYRPVLVRHLVCRLRLAPDRDKDLVQTFLCEKILGQNVIRHATPARGRFRSFVLKVFTHFVRSQIREQQALKRRPSSPDAQRLDDLPEIPAADLPPSESFDILWARQVVQRALDLMREECRPPSRQSLWAVMEARVIGPIFDDAPPMPYDEFVAKFGLRSPSEASNLLITAKRMFIRSLRKAVRETVVDDGEVEAEIMELKRILAK